MSYEHSSPRPLIEKKAVKKAYSFEVVGVLVSVLLVFAFLPQHALPISLGNGVELLGSTYFFWRYYQPPHDGGGLRSAHVVGSMQRAEIGKFFLTLAAFVVAYVSLGKTAAPWVLGGYIWAMLVQVISRVVVMIGYDHPHA